MPTTSDRERALTSKQQQKKIAEYIVRDPMTGLENNEFKNKPTETPPEDNNAATLGEEHDIEPAVNTEDSSLEDPGLKGETQE